LQLAEPSVELIGGIRCGWSRGAPNYVGKERPKTRTDVWVGLAYGIGFIVR
jgi:hypothetical protein